MSTNFVLTNKPKLGVSDTDISHILGQVPENYPRTATKIVAAYNATPGEKAGADRVCSGVADDVQINEMLATLTSGGLLQLTSGTFHIQANDSVDAFKSNTTLRGMGYSTQLIKDSLGTNIDIISLDTLSNIVIEDLYLNSNNAATTCLVIDADSVTGLVMRGLWVYGGANQMARITANLCSRVEMVNCDVSYAQGTFFNAEVDANHTDTTLAVSDTVVMGCQFRNILNTDFAVGFVTTSPRVIGNYIDTSGEGIDVCFSPQAVVQGNVVKNCVICGIYGEGGRDQVFSGNAVKSCNIGIQMFNLLGISVLTAGKSIISDNVISTTTTHGIIVQGCPRVSITNNVITDSGSHGIYIERAIVGGSNYDPAGVLIQDNIIYNFGITAASSIGVAFYRTTNALCAGNVIDGLSATEADYGIVDGGYSTNCVVENNIISNINTQSISMTGTGHTVRYNIPSTNDNWPTGGETSANPTIFANLLVDASFEKSGAASTWVDWGITEEGHEYSVYTGTDSRGATATKSCVKITDTATANCYLKSGVVACNYGDMYFASAWVKCTNTGIKSTLNIFIDWLSANLGYLSTTTYGVAGKADTNWHQVTCTGVVPAGAVYTRFIIGCAGAADPTAYLWWIDDCHFARVDTTYSTVVSVDSAAVADTVSIGGYDISAGHRALAIGTEEVVVVEIDETKFSHKFPVRINGATYYIMLTAT